MNRFALITAAAATAAALAAPASADIAFAVQHFNQDKDSAAERIALPTADDRTTVSTRGGSPLAEAFDRFNASVDSAADLRGVEPATVIEVRHSDRAAEIFAALDAE
jgi:hypothetical protein